MVASRAGEPADRVYGYGGDDLLTLGWSDTDAVMFSGEGGRRLFL